MKRIVLAIAIIALTCCAQAQEAQTEDTVSQNKIQIKLGISAGATLFNNGNDRSPYYSKHGFFVQLPLQLHWNFAPKWELATGVRYDFNWDPLYYNVEVTDNGSLAHRGITSSATQHAHHFSSYVGIPVSITFHPWPKRRNALGLTLDVFAGRAVSNYIHVEDRTLNSQSTPENLQYSIDEDKVVDPITLWKLEVGMTVSTSLLGLVHGVRLHFNLLPTYRDPATGDPIYTSGLSLFL